MNPVTWNQKHQQSALKKHERQNKTKKQCWHILFIPHLVDKKLTTFEVSCLGGGVTPQHCQKQGCFPRNDDVKGISCICWLNFSQVWLKWRRQLPFRSKSSKLALQGVVRKVMKSKKSYHNKVRSCCDGKPKGHANHFQYWQNMLGEQPCLLLLKVISCYDFDILQFTFTLKGFHVSFNAIGQVWIMVQNKMVGFRHKHHLIMVRKESWFRLK